MKNLTRTVVASSDLRGKEIKNWRQKSCIAGTQRALFVSIIRDGSKQREGNMIYAIQTLVALTVVSLLLMLVSDGFAYRVSRIAEAVFDQIEYRLALRAQGRTTRKHAVSVAYEAL